MQVSWLSIFLIFWGTSLSPALSIPMQIKPGGQFDLTYELSNGLTTSAQIDITGDLEIKVEITQGVVTRLIFTEGNIAYSDANLELVLATFPVTTKIVIETRDVVSRFTSNSEAGAIQSETGVISNSGHFLRQDRGTITTRYLIGGLVVQEEIRNLETQPDQSGLFGETILSYQLLKNSGHKALYQVNLDHARDETRTQPVTIIDGTLTITEKGGFTASGQAWVMTTDFIDWVTRERGLTPQTFDEICPLTGQPLALLYAFDARELDWIPPVIFDPVRKTIALQLPENGLKASVCLDYSTSLREGEWSHLIPTSSTTPELAIGKEDVAEFSLPQDQRGFIRLAVIE